MSSISQISPGQGAMMTQMRQASQGPPRQPAFTRSTTPQWPDSWESETKLQGASLLTGQN